MIYYSLGMDGVPFGQRYPSDQAARAGAHAQMHEFNDIERLEILKVTTQSHGYEYRAKPVTHEVRAVPKEALGVIELFTPDKPVFPDSLL